MSEPAETRGFPVGPVYELETFKRYYPEGAITSIPAAKVPPRVMLYFRNKGDDATARRFHTDHLGDIFKVGHTNGDSTFAATHQKTANNGESDLCIYLGETDANDQFLGGGEVVNNQSPDKGKGYYNTPYVGYTFTEEAFLKRGLGRRRYLVMNALSQMVNHRPLYSDDLITDEARAVWEKLVQEGRAKAYVDEGKKRYVFIEEESSSSEGTKT